MDKLRFAELISFLSSRSGTAFSDYDIREIARMTEMVSAPASMENVNELLSCMKLGQQKIPAIKAYRALTNADLRQAKDAVETYWMQQPYAA